MATLPTDDELVELAAVVRAHGLRGELLLKTFNPDSELLREAERVVLKLRDGATRAFEVRSARGHADQLLLALDGVSSRDGAEQLRGALVCVPRASLPEPAEDEYYLVDLIGLEARDATGNVIGRVEEIIQYPSVACLQVRGDQGVWEIPDTERYLSAIDLDAGHLTVENLEELDILRSDADKGAR